MAREKKPKRPFMDGYRTYKPEVEGFGSVEDWARRAEAAASEAMGIPEDLLQTRAEGWLRDNAPNAKVHRPQRQDPDLAALGLDAMPATEQELKSAFRKALIPAHPDHGGSRQKMEAISAARARVARKMKVRA